MVKEILLLGNADLYKTSEPCKAEDNELIKQAVEDLHDTLIEYRKTYGLGRAIAAPQIGVNKRLIYMNTGEPIVFINPMLEFADSEKMPVLDDCMSFPGLFVQVERYKCCKVKYFNMNWEECEISFEDDLSELIQHEYDHLDGILATMRAVDEKAFVMKKL